MNFKEKQIKAVQNAAGFINHHIINESDVINCLESFEADGVMLVPKSLMAVVVRYREFKVADHFPEFPIIEIQEELYAYVDAWKEANAVESWKDLIEKEVSEL